MKDSFGFKNALLVPMDGRSPFKGTLIITGDRISYCGDSENAPSCGNIQDGSDYIVIPGLINAHLHSDAYIFKGLLDNMNLKEQYLKTNKLGDLMDDDVMILSRTLSYIEAVRSGTTYIIEHQFRSLGERAVEPFITAGVRGAVVFDRDDITNEFVRFINSKGYDVFINLPSEEDFSIEILEDLARLSKNTGVRLYGHIAETTWRLALCYEKFSKSPVEVLEMTGVLETKPVIVHGCFLSEGDIALLAKYGASVVNTPVSEMKIGDGVAPIPSLLRCGVNVGLGTDGALWNNGADILGEAKVLLLLHSLTSIPGRVNEYDALGSVTCEGARLLRRTDIGMLHENAYADFIVMRAGEPEILPIYISQGRLNIISNIVLSAGRSCIDSVYASGREIMRDGTIVGINTKILIDRMNEWLNEKSEEIDKIIENNI